MTAPVARTTRYLCPFCDWHYDVPPPSVERIAELGAVADPGARDLNEAITFLTHSALSREMQRTEGALREHFSTHAEGP